MRPEIRLPLKDIGADARPFSRCRFPLRSEEHHLKTVGYSQDQDAVHMPVGFYRRADLEALVIRLRELSDL